MNKIKKVHTILPEFSRALEVFGLIPEVMRVIPGRISRQQKGSSHKKISFSYFTDAGMKLIVKKGATAQEVFIICKKEDKDKIYDRIKWLFGE